MPLAVEADLLCQVQCHVDRGDQRLGVAEVRALVEVDPFQGQILFFAELRGFQNLFARHAELAVMLTGLRVGVMGVDGDAGEEAEPRFGVRELAPRVVRQAASCWTP